VLLRSRSGNGIWRGDFSLPIMEVGSAAFGGIFTTFAGDFFTTFSWEMFLTALPKFGLLVKYLPF
jgi:hypothetical protein